MSDTPRTDAAYAASIGAGIYELFKESQELERELNAATYEGQHLREAYIQLREGAEKSRQHIKRLDREIEVLRLYGNKDCTAMADEALSKEAKL